MDITKVNRLFNVYSSQREARSAERSELTISSPEKRVRCTWTMGGSQRAAKQQRLSLLENIQGVRSQGVETLLRALWFSGDAEQDWNQFAFPLSIRCQGKKNGAVQLEVGSDLLLYIFRLLQPIIKFKVDRLQIILVAKKYISTCRNCSSVGCLKCVQFHNWFRLH